jgi:hypothetical protein
VDEIYNLACPASPVHYQRDPVQTTKTSVHGAINMLSLAKCVKAKILQALDFGSVWRPSGSPPRRKTIWDHLNPIGSRSCYDEGNGARRRYSSITGDNIRYVSRWRVFSIPTGHACIQMTAASYLTLSFRHCLVGISRFMATARKRVHSAMSTISPMA